MMLVYLKKRKQIVQQVLTFSILASSFCSLAFAQSYKVMLYPVEGLPLSLHAKALALPTQGGQVALLGDFKEGAPGYQAGGFLTYVDRFGRLQQTQSFGTSQPNSQNGVEMEALGFDGSGMAYMGGTSVQSIWGGPGGSERTLSAMNKFGKIAYTQMQPNYTFNDLYVEKATRSLLALSGPFGTNPVNPGMLVTRMSTSGRNMGSIGVEARVAIDPIALVEQPGLLQSVAVGTYDPNGFPGIMASAFTDNLKLAWSYVFSGPGYIYRVKDAKAAGNNQVVVTGVAQEIATGNLQGFITLLDDKGNVLFHQLISLQGKSEVGLQSVTFFQRRENAAISGIVAGGYYRERPTDRRKAFVVVTDIHGQPLWSQSYTELGLADYEYDEAITTVINQPRYGTFIAAGDHTRYLFGIANQRALFVVEASTDNGRLGVGPGCSDTLTAVSTTGSLTRQALGQPFTGGNFTSFNYNQTQLELWDDYCSRPSIRSEIGADEPSTQSMPAWLQPVSGNQTRTYLVQDPDRVGVTSIVLTDILGRTVWSQAASDQDEVSLPEISAGVYVISLRSGSQVFFSEKIAVRP